MRPQGFQLTELIIVLALVAIIALFSISSLLPQRTEQAVIKRDKALVVLNNSLDSAKTELGLLPVNSGPAQVLEQFLQSNQFDINGSALAVPASCTATVDGMPAVEANNAVVDLGSDVILAGLRPQWDTSQIAVGADVVCIATRGENSTPEETFFVTLLRKGNTPSQPPNIVIANAAGTAAPGGGTTTSSGTEASTPDTTVTVTDPSTVPPGPTPPPAGQPLATAVSQVLSCSACAPQTIIIPWVSLDSQLTTNFPSVTTVDVFNPSTGTTTTMSIAALSTIQIYDTSVLPSALSPTEQAILDMRLNMSNNLIGTDLSSSCISNSWDCVATTLQIQFTDPATGTTHQFNALETNNIDLNASSHTEVRLL